MNILNWINDKMDLVALLVFCAELIFLFIRGNITTINRTLWGWDYTNYIYLGFPLTSCLTAILYAYWKRKKVSLNVWISLLIAGLLLIHLTLCVFFCNTITHMDRTVLTTCIISGLIAQAFQLRAQI